MRKYEKYMRKYMRKYEKKLDVKEILFEQNHLWYEKN